MLRRVSIFLFIVIGMLLQPEQVRSVELGLTPSHVVGVWENVNDCIDIAILSVAEKDNLKAKASVITLKSFDGKKPSDVLAKVADVRNKLDKLRQSVKLGKTSVFRNPDGNITPSVVYLNSGHVLDGLADWLARNASSQQLVTDCYKPKTFSGKTPSDAYGMVELVDRRLDAVLAALSR